MKNNLLNEREHRILLHFLTGTFDQNYKNVFLSL